MTTENTVTETVSNDNSESKPSRTMDQASMDRIAHHESISAEKTARLATLTVGTKAHARCFESLNKNEQFLRTLRTDLAARQEKRAAKATATVAA